MVKSYIPAKVSNAEIALDRTAYSTHIDDLIWKSINI